MPVKFYIESPVSSALNKRTFRKQSDSIIVDDKCKITMCRTNDMIDRNYKLLTADLSQVICGRSLLDELAASSSSARFSDGDKEVQAVVTDQKRLLSDAYAAHTALHNRRDSVITMTKDGSTLDESNSSSLTDVSADAGIDTADRRQRIPAAMPTFPNQDNLKRDIPHTSSATQSAPSRSGPTIRRRSQPLHKCPSMNQAISSIMKPSRYSSACKVGDSKATTKLSRLDTSLTSTAASSSSSSSHTSANRWIASGVVFSSSVEVYLFRI